MPELKELVAPGAAHTAPNDKCPFCPPQDGTTYTTYPGASNNSKKLAVIMTRPKSLLSEQSGARPQNAREDASGHQQEQDPPDQRKRDKRRWYTFQAHHLISGNQAMKGESIEDWIKASKRNEKATGYSINCTGNGFWAPSVPKKYVGKWAANKKVLTDDERQAIAEEVMKDFGAQIHIGPHNIADPDDPKGYIHDSYDKYIKRKLKELDRRIVAWKKKCYLCKPKNKKPQATHQVHNALDGLSTHLQGKISGGRKTWHIFLSKYAMEYHKPVCSHKRKKKK